MDAVDYAFGRDMKPEVNFNRKLQKLMEAERNKNKSPGTATKVNEKITVQLQTKKKKEA